MNRSEIQLRDQLLYLLEGMDRKLLQRVYDYTNGLIAGTNDAVNEDWWDSLTDEQKQIIDQGISESGSDELLSEKEMSLKVKALFNNQI